MGENGDDVADIDDVTNPIDLSAEAALELEEVKQGIREDAPALIALFSLLRTPLPAPKFEGKGGLSMLADVRAYAILRDSVGAAKMASRDFPEFRKHIETYLNDLEKGVISRKRAKVDEAKRFCLSLNENLLSKKMTEIYQRRERANSRYVFDDSVS